MKRTLAAIGAALLAAGCGTNAPHQAAGGSVQPPGWGRPAPPSVRVPLFATAPNTTATMYDTITLETVPANPFALAGYTSGFWPTFLPLRAHYPSAHVVSIAVTAHYHADCLDVEPGDATPREVTGWIKADRAAGWPRPCLYSSYYEFVERVRPALERAHIARSSVWEWDADYTYSPHIDVGFDGTQWTDRAFGRNLDASVVTRAFLAIAHPPLVPPKPKPKPKPDPRIAADRARIALLRSFARNRGCYAPWWVDKPRACSVWGAEVRGLKVAIARLERKGAH